MNKIIAILLIFSYSLFADTPRLSDFAQDLQTILSAKGKSLSFRNLKQDDLNVYRRDISTALTTIPPKLQEKVYLFLVSNDSPINALDDGDESPSPKELKSLHILRLAKIVYAEKLHALRPQNQNYKSTLISLYESTIEDAHSLLKLQKIDAFNPFLLRVKTKNLIAKGNTQEALQLITKACHHKPKNPELKRLHQQLQIYAFLDQDSLKQLMAIEVDLMSYKFKSLNRSTSILQKISTKKHQLLFLDYIIRILNDSSASFPTQFYYAEERRIYAEHQENIDKELLKHYELSYKKAPQNKALVQKFYKLIEKSYNKKTKEKYTISLLNQLIKIEASNIQYHHDKIYYLHHERDLYQEAIKAVDQALLIFPDNAGLYLSKMNALQSLKDKVKFKRHLPKATELCRNDRTDLAKLIQYTSYIKLNKEAINLAQLAWSKYWGDYTTSRILCEEYFKNNKPDTSGHSAELKLVKKRQYLVEATLNKYLKRSDKLPPRNFNFSEKEFYAKEIKRVEKALNANNKQAFVWQYAAQVYGAISDKYSALYCLNQALKLSPKDPKLYFARSRSFPRKMYKKQKEADFNTTLSLLENWKTIPLPFAKRVLSAAAYSKIKYTKRQQVTLDRVIFIATKADKKNLLATEKTRYYIAQHQWKKADASLAQVKSRYTKKNLTRQLKFAKEANPSLYHLLAQYQKKNYAPKVEKKIIKLILSAKTPTALTTLLRTVPVDKSRKWKSIVDFKKDKYTLFNLINKPQKSFSYTINQRKNPILYFARAFAFINTKKANWTKCRENLAMALGLMAWYGDSHKGIFEHQDWLMLATKAQKKKLNSKEIMFLSIGKNLFLGRFYGKEWVQLKNSLSNLSIDKKSHILMQEYKENMLHYQGKNDYITVLQDRVYYATLDKLKKGMIELQNISPKNPHIELYQSRILFLNNRYQEALKLCTSFIKKFPTNKHGYSVRERYWAKHKLSNNRRENILNRRIHGLILVESTHGTNSNNLDEFFWGELYKLYNNNHIEVYQAIHKKANVAFKQGESLLAYAAYHYLLHTGLPTLKKHKSRLNPKWVTKQKRSLTLLLSEQAYRAKKYKKAIQFIESALTLSPSPQQSLSLKRFLANSYFGLKQYALVSKVCDDVLLYDSTNTIFLTIKGRVLSTQKKYDESNQVFSLIKKESSNFDYALYMLTYNAYKQKKYLVVITLADLVREQKKGYIPQATEYERLAQIELKKSFQIEQQNQIKKVQKAEIKEAEDSLLDLIDED